MAEDETYLRAKLTEINGAIDRLTDMLNRMIEVISKITEVQDATSDIALAVAANSEKLNEILGRVDNISKAPAPVETISLETKGAMSSLQAVLETLESQIREGVIASDLAKKINEAATSFEQKSGSTQLVVKMNRWVRILRTYGRIDEISSADLKKLRNDLTSWQRELATGR
jgi:hypothetical protein